VSGSAKKKHRHSKAEDQEESNDTPKPNQDEIKAAMKNIVSRLIKDKRAGPFSSPVDLDSAPGYAEAIQIPMDLSTVKANISAQVYGTDIFAFARDMRLIWSNCMTYNVPDSALYAHASQLKDLFEDMYKIAFQDILKGMRRKSVKREKSSGSDDGNEASASALSKEDALKRLKKFLKEIFNHPNSEPFHYPVDTSVAPGYLDVVERPMDLSYIRKHLSEYGSGEIADINRCLDDVLLIYDNCMAYNADGSDLFKIAKELRKFTKQLFSGFFSDVLSKASKPSKGSSASMGKRNMEEEGPVKKRGRPSKADSSHSSHEDIAAVTISSAESKTGDSDMAASILKKLKKLLKFVYNHPKSEPFHYPVDVRAAPGYLDVVERPMDLSYLTKHLAEYATGNKADIERFLDDILLTFKNCMAYNADGSDLFESAKELAGFAKQQYKEIFFKEEEEEEEERKPMAKKSGKVDKSDPSELPEKARGKVTKRRSSSPPVEVKDVNASLHKRLRKLVRLVYENPLSEPFHHPVDISAAPGYLDVVERPMDLSYIKRHLPEYANRESANSYRCLEDILLIFKNCMAYNADGSDLFEKAKELSGFTKQQYDEIFPRNSGSKKNEQPVEIPPNMNQDVLKALKRVLKLIYDHPQSAPFHHPVDITSAPGYLDVVKKPIDLSYVRRHLPEYATGERAGLEKFLDDVLRVFENCRLYESSDTDNYSSAVVLTSFVNELYATTFYKRYFEVLKRKNKRSLSPPVVVEDLNATHHKRLKKFLKIIYENPLSEPFHYPVDVRAAPGYLDVVERPMDLSYLTKHLAEYATGNKADIERFLDDVLLIFDNCMAYNADGSDLYVTAKELSQFVKLQYDEIFSADFFEKGNKKTLARPKSPPVVVEDVNHDVLKQLRKFLKSIWEHPKVAEFIDPVDLSNSPGYLDVVTRPMDLSYVKKHLPEYATGSARDIQCCLDDILLIFENCRAYNSSESEKYIDSVTLTDFAKELFSITFTSKYLQKLAEREPKRERWSVLDDFADTDIAITRAVSGDVEAASELGEDAIMTSGIRDSLKLAEKNSHSLFDTEIAAMSFEKVLAFHLELQSDRAVHCAVVRDKAHNDSQKFLKHFLAGKSSSDLYVCGSLGTIGTDGAPRFHNEEYIFPLGYSCKRTLILSVVPSTSNGLRLDHDLGSEEIAVAMADGDEELVNPVEYPHVEVVFSTFVKKTTDEEGNISPLFQITVGEGIAVTESTVSPGEAWQQALREGPKILHCMGSKLRRCRAVLNRLCTSPDIVPYLEEVPSEGAIGESYYKKIKSPMWLKEIHRRLVQGSYDNEFDFAWDVRLVFANCMDYNKEDSELYQNASNILIHFEKLFCSWVLNVKDPSINDLAKGVWDDWTRMRFLDGNGDVEICCRSGCKEISTARNKLLFCEFCEDFYCKAHSEGGEEDVSDIANATVWRCRRCVDIISHEFDLPEVKYRRSEDPAGLYAPADKMGRGWNFCGDGYMSPLGYEFSSIAQAKCHIVTEKQLNTQLLAERAKEFEEYKRTNAKFSHTTKRVNKKKLANGSPMKPRPRREDKDKGKDSSAADAEGDAGSDGGKNLMLLGKLSNLDLEGSEIVWAGLAEESDGGLFLGIFSPENLSPAGFSGLDDYTIHRSIEGLPGSMLCENYIFDNAESIMKSYRKAVSAVVERREREHKADALLQERITEERYFWRNIEAKCRREQKELLMEASESREKFDSTIANNKAFHNDMNGILNTLLPSDWEVTTDEFEALIYVWEYMYVSKKHSISPIFGLTEIVKSVQPGQVNDFPTVACVLFDEACVMMVDVLLQDIRRVLYGQNLGMWQEFLLIHPLNVLTWPHLAYNLLLTLTRLHYSKALTSGRALLTLVCAKDADMRFFLEILYLIECNIMATVANHSTDGIPDTQAEIDVALFSDLARDIQSGDLPYDDIGQFVMDVRDMVDTFVAKNPLHNHLSAWVEAILVEYALDGIIDRSLCGLEDEAVEMEAGVEEMGDSAECEGAVERAPDAAEVDTDATFAAVIEASEQMEEPAQPADDDHNATAKTVEDAVDSPVVSLQPLSPTKLALKKKKKTRTMTGNVLKTSLVDNLSICVRIMLRKDPSDFSVREKIAIYTALAQLGYMSGTMSAPTLAIIKAARANEAPISPLSAAVQTRLLESLKPVDTSSRGSGAPVLKCYFTGLEAKNIDEGGDWVYVPEQYLSTPSVDMYPSTMAAVINTTEPANAVSDDEEEPSANTLSLRHTAMRTHARADRDREGKKVCLKQMLLKVAAARESAKEEYSGVSAHVSAIAKIAFYILFPTNHCTYICRIKGSIEYSARDECHWFHQICSRSHWPC
jgi:hypothetical protein